MRILDRLDIKGRGHVFTLKNDREVRHAGAHLRRMSDGRTWPIGGFERRAILRNGADVLHAGEDIGVLIKEPGDLATGDEVEIVEAGSARPLLCNALHTVSGIDLNDPDPDADFVTHDVECGRPALYGERNHAGSGWANTLFCQDCFDALGSDGQMDVWPLLPEAIRRGWDVR